MLSWNVTDTTPPLEAAIAYGHAGLRVVWIHAPTAQGCTCGSARCERRSWGKHPILSAWQRVASGDEATLRDQYARLKIGTNVPNVGIVLGEQPNNDHLIAIDVDNDDRLAELVAEHGPLPETLTGKSARGARLFFKAPGDLKNVTGIGGTPGVDMKARGGQVVVAPSLHESGARYLWEYPLRDIATLPDGWVLALKPAYKVPTEFATYTPFTLKEDKRATSRAEKYLHRAVVAEAEMLARIGMGNRNTTLHTALCRLLPLAHGLMLPSGHATVIRELRNAASAAGLQQREIETTIASAEKWLRESGAVRVLPHEVSKAPASDAADGTPAAPGSAAPADVEFGPDVKLIEDNGQPAKIAENVERMLPFYPRGVPRYDAFTDRIVWPDGSLLEDGDAAKMQGWLYSQPAAKRVRAGTDTVHDAFVSYARSHQFDSLHEYLRALPAWDEKPRLDTWLIDLAGCKDTPATRLFARLWMISVMARGTRAGSRVDGVLVLEGEQGAGKNRLLEALFAPYLKSLGSYEPGDVEAARIAGSCWVLHDDEFGGAKSDVDALKAFVSSTEDTYRPPYGRELLTRKRRAVMIASTNRPTYLTDDKNRRFMPVTCATEKSIDVDGAAVVREQLFAEALAMHEAKEPWWFDASNADVEAEQDARRAVDGLALDVARHTAGKDRVQLPELCDLLGIPPERRDKKLEMRLGAALRELGFKRVRAMISGVRAYWYERAIVGPVCGGCGGRGIHTADCPRGNAPF